MKQVMWCDKHERPAGQCTYWPSADLNCSMYWVMYDLIPAEDVESS